MNNHVNSHSTFVSLALVGMHLVSVAKTQLQHVYSSVPWLCLCTD